MKHTHMIALTGLSLAVSLIVVPAHAQQPATAGTLLVSAPGALGVGPGAPSPKPVVSIGEALQQSAAAAGSVDVACVAESQEGCSEADAPRTGLLTDAPASRAGVPRYGSIWFGSAFYGGGGGTGISPRTFSAATAGGATGAAAVPFVPVSVPSLPGASLLPNLCLP